MLELLHIENIAVIEEADIRFHPGFNALTGETGAGKSIVIDAMGAVLGGRTSRDLIRTGASKAFVSAEFSQVPADLPALERSGITPDEDGVLLLQREMLGDGKNQCRANGRPITVAQLREIGSQLLNIHGQHDGQQLLDEEQHGQYLDRFGRTEPVLAAYREQYGVLRALEEQIRSLQMDEAEKARRMDSLQFQISELERAGLQPGEEEELRERRELLRNGEKYLSALQGADYCLSGGDETDGAVAVLQNAENALYGIRNLSGEIMEIYQRLQQARCEVYDLAAIVQDKRQEFDFSPAELDEVESRCDLLYRLKKKYGATVEDMLAYLDRCRQELDAMETADDTLARLEQKLPAARKKVADAGAALTKARKAAAGELEKRILRELRDLDMNKVRFSIEFTPVAPGPEGCDAIRFLMSANAGEDLKPIARIASGGELARIMLALKNVLAEQESIGTLVFDEVDTGVSGRAAQKVAEKLAQVSRRKQVLCVTHLPQLAAMADTHFSVSKGERDGRTYTRVVNMDREQRKAELARITGGSRVTEALLESAGELLDAAETYRVSLS
ncbi:DNA repair protein RecN [Dysosmobacter sp.]|uniref:DNA repair protein RecN n=1 Tax=Dysosmobacter sp. TaxID=2591382 RepID=UPI002A874A11|nr:DNA repair protein RecN [Dysosmobacter sp.]MDY3282648.1 DNA repair protein RecN [Dysosmobacter sp.]